MTSTPTLPKRILSLLARLLVLMVSLILCLPVILLPLATAVPAWAWILLIAADLALLVLFFRLKPTWKAVALAVTACFWWVSWPSSPRRLSP